MKGIYEIDVYHKDGQFLKQDDRPSSMLGKADRELRKIVDSFLDIYPGATCVDIRVIYQLEPAAEPRGEEPTNAE